MWVGLEGTACERIVRNRGAATRVAPLSPLPRELFAWIGLNEVWDIDAGAKPFIFRQLGLSIHLGYVGDPVKPQILRLEWPGVRDWHGAGLGYQSQGAGHPHWQIDVLESLAHQTPASESFEPTPTVEDFGTEQANPDILSVVKSITFERMHLASAAPWWTPAPAPQTARHINAPTDLDGLTRWLTEGVHYIQQELCRCAVR